VDRSCGPMDKNRIRGDADQGERARNREALVTKGKRRRSGGRAVKECVLTWGDLALCLKGRRGKGPEMASNRSEKSAEVGSGMAANEGPNEEECSPLSMWEALRQMPA
jgi:hypothetical protein